MVVQSKIAEILLPVFLTILIGYIFGRFKEINTKPIMDLMLYVSIPCLIISSILKSPLVPSDFIVIPGAVLFVVLGTGLITFFILKVHKFDHAPGIYMSSMFINSGILAFPILSSAFGAEGLSKGIIFDAINGLLIFSLGVQILVGKDDVWKFLKLPVIYAILAAVILSFSGLKPPAPVMDAISFTGSSALPILLVILGYQLNYLRTHAFGYAFLASLLRIGCGIGLSLIFVNVFGIQGILRQVIVLSSSMPTAMNSLLLSEEFRVDPDIAASAVIITTLLSFITIPLVLRYLL